MLPNPVAMPSLRHTSMDRGLRVTWVSRGRRRSTSTCSSSVTPMPTSLMRLQARRDGGYAARSTFAAFGPVGGRTRGAIHSWPVSRSGRSSGWCPSRRRRQETECAGNKAEVSSKGCWPTATCKGPPAGAGRPLDREGAHPCRICRFDRCPRSPVPTSSNSNGCGSAGVTSCCPG
jgi:hypothetical protein